MKNLTRVMNWTVVLLSLSSSANLFGATGEPVSLETWPRVIFRDGATNTIYQPQLESWDYFTLKASCAVSIQPTGNPQPTFGTMQITAKTRVDRANREVFFESLEIPKADFPSAGSQANIYLATLRSMIPKEVKSIGLDRLESSLAILEARKRASGQPLRNEPPTILFSLKPAMLIPVDGPAVYRPVEKTKVARVANTRALILRDESGQYYLHLFDGYVTAPGLNGPWTVAKKVPRAVKKAEKAAVKAKQVDLLAGEENPETKKKPSLKSTPIPELYVTFVPTELIVLQEEPQWVPIPTTQLLYATNTVSHVFKELVDQKIYVLISGRWFRAPTFEGPWAFVPSADLPKDFAAIPDDSPQENVKASVPGTRQAKEASIANAIPQTVKVDRSTAKLDPPPNYDGAPLVKPIDGTPLHYVANCQTPVIEVDAKSWYACRNGVWFVATSSSGPWVVATSVPAVIYSIPPSSPVYYVVYTRIYSYDNQYVWVGTTPGYYGTVIGPDGTVVYGTGYAYPPYVGSSICVSYSVTYGYGCNPCWTPWAGWAFGFAVGWSSAASWSWWCCCPPAPYWGPYWYGCYGAHYNAYGGITSWGPYGWAGTSGYIYHQNGPWTGVSRGAAGFNAWTGNQWMKSYGHAYNSTTGTRVAGQRGAVQNVYTGNYAYGSRGVAYNDRTGISGAGGKVTWGNAATGNQGAAGRGTIYNPNTGNATHISGARGESGGYAAVNGHVVAGKDGNYYRPDGNGGWQQLSRPGSLGNNLDTGGINRSGGLSDRTQGWQSFEGGGEQRRSLDNEFQSRQLGEMRQRSFQMNRPSFGGFRGGGGFRGFRR